MNILIKRAENVVRWMLNADLSAGYYEPIDVIYEHDENGELSHAELWGPTDCGGRLKLCDVPCWVDDEKGRFPIMAKIIADAPPVIEELLTYVDQLEEENATLREVAEAALEYGECNDWYQECRNIANWAAQLQGTARAEMTRTRYEAARAWSLSLFRLEGPVANLAALAKLDTR